MKRLIILTVFCMGMASSALALSDECTGKSVNLARCVWSVIYDLFHDADGDGLSGSP